MQPYIYCRVHAPCFAWVLLEAEHWVTLSLSPLQKHCWKWASQLPLQEARKMKRCIARKRHQNGTKDVLLIEMENHTEMDSAPFREVFKSRLDGVMGNLIWCLV